MNFIISSNEDINYINNIQKIFKNFSLNKNIFLDNKKLDYEKEYFDIINNKKITKSPGFICSEISKVKLFTLYKNFYKNKPKNFISNYFHNIEIKAHEKIFFLSFYSLISIGNRILNIKNNNFEQIILLNGRRHRIYSSFSLISIDFHNLNKIITSIESFNEIDEIEFKNIIFNKNIINIYNKKNFSIVKLKKIDNFEIKNIIDSNHFIKDGLSDLYLFILPNFISFLGGSYQSAIFNIPILELGNILN
jgi:hypothetical protein